MYHKVKGKEREKRDEYLDLPREVKNNGTGREQWELILVETLWTIPKSSEGETESTRNSRKIETIHTTTQLSSYTILFNVNRSSETVNSHYWCEKFARGKWINNNNNNNNNNLVYSAVSIDHWVKGKWIEKLDKYLLPWHGTWKLLWYQ